MNNCFPASLSAWFAASLRRTLILGSGLAILLPALLLGYFQIGRPFKNEVEHRTRTPAQHYADVLSHGLPLVMWNLDLDAVSEQVEAVMRDPDVVSVTVTNDHNEVAVHRQRPIPSQATPLTELREIYFRSERQGHLVVALSPDRIERLLMGELFALSLALAAQVVISFVFIWLLFERRLVRPMATLQLGAQRLARGELDKPMEWRGRDEIGRLAEGLDRMRLDWAALIAERLQAQAALRLIDAQMEHAFGASPIGMALVALDGRFLRVNQSFCGIVGWTETELLVSGFQAITYPDDLAPDLLLVQEVIAGQRQSYQMEKRYLHKAGHTVWAQLNVSMVRDADGAPLHFVSQIQNITERKQTQSALQSSLREKTALLNEVHHRVKNNLQIITSLLRLESRRSEHPATQAVLGDMQSRIRSMALLHESIYRAGSFSAIDLGAYLGQVATQTFRSMLVSAGAVHLRLALDRVEVGLDQATPCGLLLSELVSNCLKHGFPDGGTGEVCIELHPVPDSAQWCLRVSDTGVGLPADLATRQADSLGLQLVSDLTTQLGGTLEIGPGAVFTIKFVAIAPAPLADGIQ